MRQILFPILLLLCSTSMLAQEDDRELKILSGTDQIDSTRNVNTRWFLMDLGVDGLDIKSTTKINGQDPLGQKISKSTNVNLHLLQVRHNLVDHKLNVSWGLTFEFHKHYFTNNVVMVPDQAQTTFVVASEDLDKRRLSYSALTVPLMMQFESNPNDLDNSLHLSVGVYGGRLLGANFKTKDGKDKVKTKDNFNLNQWRYGLRGEIGFGFLSLYGTLALNDLFESDRNGGYQATPFSVGVIILPY